ncbi:MAG: class I SAM-dependent methyltransferase [Sphingomicrobium sp.]
MSPLARALAERIRRDGPLSVEAYMDACNAYYYATRDPLGAGGDFTTAPEIHQMYGEMIGAALADAWGRAGRPEGIRYAELGPGRGTLAADALRVMAAAGCVPVSVELVETSPALRAAQSQKIPRAKFHDGIAGLADGAGPLLVVANEFFDALPVRQYVGEQERHLILAAGGLAFDRDGEVVERSPAREQAMAELAGLLRERGGIAILIDYGHDREGAAGDTLQAVRGHRFAYVLDRPGEQDLTCHVDFAALARVATASGAKASRPVSQGSWLETLGIGARAMALAASNPAKTEAIAAARRRLCDDDQMGRLFKVMAIRAPDWPEVAGLER